MLEIQSVLYFNHLFFQPRCIPGPLWGIYSRKLSICSPRITAPTKTGQWWPSTDPQYILVILMRRLLTCVWNYLYPKVWRFRWCYLQCKYLAELPYQNIKPILDKKDSGCRMFCIRPHSRPECLYPTYVKLAKNHSTQDNVLIALW